MKEVIVPADDLVCIGKEKLQELIRCKECKYWEDGMRIDRTPVHRCAIDHFVWEADDYCSQAEKR